MRRISSETRLMSKNGRRSRSSRFPMISATLLWTSRSSIEASDSGVRGSGGSNCVAVMVFVVFLIVGFAFGVRMALLVNANQVSTCDVCVYLGSRNGRMTEKFLDKADVGAAIQQVRGEAVTQRMRMNAGESSARGHVVNDFRK